MWKSRTYSKTIRGIRTLARARTQFNQIIVTKNNHFRDLWLGKDDRFFLQSRLDVNKRNDLILVYSRLMMSALFFQSRPLSILMIGLGGGALCHFLKYHFPEARIDVVEVDSQIIDVARRYFFVRETNHLLIHNADGRVWVRNRLGKKTYDIVFLDAFKSDSIPYHLKTQEFYQEIHRLLSPGGVVVSNLYGKSNRQKQTDRLTFASVFNQTCLFEDAEQKATVLIATHGKKAVSAERCRNTALHLVSLNKIPGWMWSVAGMWRAGGSVAPGNRVFRDNFSREDFLRAVLKNNCDGNIPRPCPINQF